MKPQDRSAAILTLLDAEDLSPKGRHAVALWLRRQGAYLERHGHELSHRFTARYLKTRRK